MIKKIFLFLVFLARNCFERKPTIIKNEFSQLNEIHGNFCDQMRASSAAYVIDKSSSLLKKIYDVMIEKFMVSSWDSQIIIIGKKNSVSHPYDSIDLKTRVYSFYNTACDDSQTS